LRWSGIAAVGALCFIGLSAVHDAVLGEILPDPGEWTRILKQLDTETNRDQELTEEMKAVLQRGRLRRQISRDLIDGRLTLREAARRLAGLPELPGRLEETERKHHPAADDEAGLSREAIEWACNLLSDEPDREHALRQKLEKELLEIAPRSLNRRHE
jgi:hypothetical protein